MKYALFLILTLQLSFDTLSSPGQCVFNLPSRSVTPTGRIITTQTQSQGFVEDFGNPLETIQDTAGSLYWGSCKDEASVPVTNARELFEINCSGLRGNGYSNQAFNSLERLNQYSTEYLDQTTEELVFMQAAQNVHKLGKCQKGLFDDYFSPDSEQKQNMLETAYERFQRIKQNVRNEISSRASDEVSRSERQRFSSCTNDSCAGRYSEESFEAISEEENVEARLTESDENLNLLISSIPMGNRKSMKEALLSLYRVKPNASQAEFEAVFNHQMRQLREEANSTVETMDAIHVQSGPDSEHYCVDSHLKRQLYRSGQIEVTLQRLDIGEYGSNFSCRMGRRYGYAGEIITELALIPTYFFGYGLARLATRAGVSGLSARGARALNMSSRLGMLGIQSADMALLANSAANACFTDDFMVGLQGKECSPQSEMALAMHEAELSNCLINVAFFGVSNLTAVSRMRRGNNQIQEDFPVKVEPVPVERTIAETTPLAASGKRTPVNTNPNPVRSDISETQVVNDVMDNIILMRVKGIEYEPTSLPGVLSHNVANGTQSVTNNGERAGRVYRVTGLPASGNRRGPNINAYEHPDLAVYVERLREMGVELVIDSTTQAAGMGAYFWRRSDNVKILSLPPHSTWRTFLHEFQHAEFDNLVMPFFDRMKAVRASGTNLAEAARPDWVQRVGVERLNRIQELMDQGMPVRGINETLSVEVELAALGLRRYLPNQGSRTSAYAYRHQITALEQIPEASRTSAQAEALTQAHRNLEAALRRQRLERQIVTAAGSRATGAILLGSAIGGSALEAADTYLDIDSFYQILFDEDNKPVMGQTFEGEWFNFLDN